MILLCLTVAQSNHLGSKKLNDEIIDLEQEYRSIVVEQAKVKDGRKWLLARNV